MGRPSKADQFLAKLGTEPGAPNSSDLQTAISARLKCLELANTMQLRGTEEVLERAAEFALWALTGRK